MSISPHTSETLVHRHVLLQDLLHHALASVILASHEKRLDLRRGERKPLYGFWQAEKSKGTIASGDVFEAEAIGWYLKT